MTASESGLTGFEANVWYALVAPFVTSADVIARLNAAANHYLKSDKAKTLFEDLRIQPAGRTPHDMESFIAMKVQKSSPIIRAENIRI
jgi:tripartite-type tricarboxylate transporter receptor subunit TctC